VEGPHKSYEEPATNLVLYSTISVQKMEKKGGEKRRTCGGKKFSTKGREIGGVGGRGKWRGSVAEAVLKQGNLECGIQNGGRTETLNRAASEWYW